MVGGYLRELRPSRNSLHHLLNGNTEWSVFVPNEGKPVFSPTVSLQTLLFDSQTSGGQFANCLTKIIFKTELNYGKQPDSEGPASDK